MDRIASTIVEREPLPGARVFVAHRATKDVVTFEGSILGGETMLPADKNVVPTLAAELLDAGTAKKNKRVIREGLAGRGADLSFWTHGDRTYFSGSCLPEDLEFILKTARECLTQAAFPQTELASARERRLAGLNDDRNDTKSLAAGALTRLVYDPLHENYADTIDTSIERTKAVTRKDLASFRAHLGYRGLVLAVVGDVAADDAGRAIGRAFGALPEGGFELPRKHRNRKAQKAQSQFIPVADKANIDVFWGASVPFTAQDVREYVAFTTLTDMLGGRGLSSGHLMRTIRERDGLTYGIYALPSGFEDGADGLFRIWATFSPATFNRAVLETQKEIGMFLKTGITEEALEKRKVMAAGRYQVGLGTTSGLATVLHAIGRQGKPLSFIDESIDLVRALTVADLRNVAALVPFDRLSLAAAGTKAK